jgi:signal transduction histidine kinase
LELTTLLKRIRLAEWCIIAITAACQSLWTWGNSSNDPLYISSFVCLGLAAALASLIATKPGGVQTITTYSLQGLLYCIAMATGTFRLYGLVFLLLAAKIGLLEGTRNTVILASLLYIGHGAAHLISQHFYRTHMHAVFSDHPMFAVINFIESQVISAALFASVILFARAAMAEKVSRRKANRLTKEIETMAMAVERSRIVRDIHDGVGHSLTSLNIQLELTAKLMPVNDQNSEARQALEVSRKIANGALSDLRKSLKTVKEDDINLAEAVTSIADRMKEQGAISFDIKIDDSFLSTAARQNLLLIVKECLTNIQKHAAASNVQIHLASKFGKAELVVSDNGQGFPQANKADGLGIKGMHERVSSLGGTFNIKSDPGKGTRILISLPP